MSSTSLSINFVIHLYAKIGHAQWAPPIMYLAHEWSTCIFSDFKSAWMNYKSTRIDPSTFSGFKSTWIDTKSTSIAWIDHTHTFLVKWYYFGTNYTPYSSHYWVKLVLAQLSCRCSVNGVQQSLVSKDSATIYTHVVTWCYCSYPNPPHSTSSRGSF